MRPCYGQIPGHCWKLHADSELVVASGMPQTPKHEVVEPPCARQVTQQRQLWLPAQAVT